jgi:lipopolysaccharide biosynthesis regulator YciM
VNGHFKVPVFVPIYLFTARVNPAPPDPSDTLAFPPTPEEKRPGPWRKILLWCGVLLVLGFVARPGYHFFKKQRARALAQNAIECLDRSDLTNALRYAQAAYLMQPGEPAALRSAARVQTTLGHTNALEFWQALLKSGSAQSEDRRAFVDLGLRLHAVDRVRPELRNLVESEPADHRTLWLLSRLSFVEGKQDESLAFTKQALAKDPENKEYRLFAAASEFSSPDPVAQARGQKTLLELMRDPSAAGLDAVVFLARNNPGRELIPELIEKLNRHPLSRTVHRVVALQLAIQLEPARKADLINEALGRFQSSTSDLAIFAAFLSDNREFATLVWAIPRERAVAEPALLLPYLDALGALDRWSEVQDILTRPDLPLPEAYREAFRARTAMKLGDAAAAGAAWRRALQAGSANPAELEFLARYAERGGEYDQANRAYRALAATQSDNLPVYLRWSRFLQEHGSTAELREILKIMAERWPEEVSFKNDVTYLDLLLRQNAEASLRTAEALVQSNPDLLPFRTTLALARLRANQPAAALEAFGPTSWDWNKALPASRAIYAAALAANGREQEALDQRFATPLAQLRPEEIELLPKDGRTKLR